jgi:hypothetical protein
MTIEIGHKGHSRVPSRTYDEEGQPSNVKALARFRPLNTLEEELGFAFTVLLKWANEAYNVHSNPD